MPTLTAGNTFSTTVAGDQTVDIAVSHNSSGRMTFVPSNASFVAGDGGGGASFGPLAMSKTYGPFGVSGTFTLFCDVGSVTYTVNSSSFNNIAVTGGAIDGTPIGATTRSTGAFTTLGVNSTCAIAASSATVSITATTGNVTLGATTTGTTTITRVNSLTVVSSDSSGTPGNATNNNMSGRAAFAAAASTVVITNSQVTAASKIFVSLTGTADATLKYVTVTPGAGSFTVTGNAAATATTVFDFLVVN